MKIYTKTGDKGQTSLIGGTKVPKYDMRIESYGTVDELNSYIGLVRDQELGSDIKQTLKTIQEKLFTIGASLAADPEKSKMITPDILEADIVLLENEMDKMDEALPKLKYFILPGGHTVVSFCHIARCVCRRAERLIVHLAENNVVDERVIRYMNRLSDFLFVLARTLAKHFNATEYIWLTRT